MAGVDRQRQMLLHRLAVVAPRHQGDRGPEGAHALEMRVPVPDPLGEDGAENGIGAHAVVEGADEAIDHRLVDAGASNDVRRRLRPARLQIHIGHEVVILKW